MFQEFRTQNRTYAYLINVLFPIWLCVLFFKDQESLIIFLFVFVFVFFPKALLDPVFPVIAVQRFDFKEVS